jgi:hypothetical protein
MFTNGKRTEAWASGRNEMQLQWIGAEENVLDHVFGFGNRCGLGIAVLVGCGRDDSAWGD